MAKATSATNLRKAHQLKALEAAVTAADHLHDALLSLEQTLTNEAGYSDAMHFTAIKDYVEDLMQYGAAVMPADVAQAHNIITP